jgi:hypothetical protein
MPGQEATVRIQAIVSPAEVGDRRISIASPTIDNPGPEELARCCAAALVETVPPGWNPGTSGVVTFDVTL